MKVVLKGKVYVDYRIKRHTPLPVLYISPPPTLLNFYHYRDSSNITVVEVEFNVVVGIKGNAV